ncbi:MAG TPA: DUF2628 domain-containing protein [Sphingobium sp.]|uniref:DUF2628 domain-containing protein n=1 Tax=Sphingobium sp. TaxID=1912891 RepID=UPI002ED479AC
MGRKQERLARVQAQWEITSWEDMETFIGPHAGHFEKTWIKLRQGVAIKGYANAFGFCWPALLFGFAWFFARKQWAVGALIVILPILFAILFQGLPGGAMTGISIAMASFAKSLYLQTSVPKVARIIEDSVSGSERDARLRAAGGISVPGAIGGGILLALMLASAVYAVMHAA